MQPNKQKSKREREGEEGGGQVQVGNSFPVKQAVCPGRELLQITVRTKAAMVFCLAEQACKMKANKKKSFQYTINAVTRKHIDKVVMTIIFHKI